jgi:hypothetical protein
MLAFRIQLLKKIIGIADFGKTNYNETKEKAMKPVYG